MTKKHGKRVEALVEAAQSQSTREGYAADVRHFKRCGGKVPATPEKVADYLAQNEHLAVATLQRRLVAIHRAHVDAGFESPVRDVLVRRTMQGIRRTYGVAQRRVRAIVRDDLLEILLAVAKQRPLKAARDKALLLVGFAGAFRRSELVALTVEDITPHSHGMELLLRRSKTDQEGMGRMVFIPVAKAAERCPVSALRAWLGAAGIGSGRLFRAVNRHDQVSARGMTGQSVALIVKSAVAAAKGADAAKDVAGHSLRAGFVTEAAITGMPTAAIMGQTGHKSLEMVMRYVRPVEKRRIASLL